METREHNDDIIDLINEAVWLEDEGRATDAFNELVKAVNSGKYKLIAGENYRSFMEAFSTDQSDIWNFANKVAHGLLNGPFSAHQITELRIIWRWAKREADLTPCVREKEITDCNIISVKVEHNGIQGGDAGHGGFVRLTIKDEASTCMLVDGKEVGQFTLEVRGDSERRTLIEALEFALAVLNE